MERTTRLIQGGGKETQPVDVHSLQVTKGKRAQEALKSQRKSKPRISITQPDGEREGFCRSNGHNGTKDDPEGLLMCLEAFLQCLR